MTPLIGAGIFTALLIILVIIDILFGDWGGPSDPFGDDPPHLRA